MYVLLKYATKNVRIRRNMCREKSGKPWLSINFQFVENHLRIINKLYVTPIIDIKREVVNANIVDKSFVLKKSVRAYCSVVTVIIISKLPPLPKIEEGMSILAGISSGMWETLFMNWEACNSGKKNEWISFPFLKLGASPRWCLKHANFWFLFRLWIAPRDGMRHK